MYLSAVPQVQFFMPTAESQVGLESEEILHLLKAHPHFDLVVVFLAKVLASNRQKAQARTSITDVILINLDIKISFTLTQFY